MPSPFPGMDPYLEDEQLWLVFQHQFVACLRQILLPALTDRYKVRILQREYATEPDPSAMPVREEYIEVRQKGEGPLVTLIDIVSPFNKTIPAGRRAYLNTRREGRTANANLVEIDLVLQGQPTLDYSRDGLPDWDYAVTVTRSTQPERYEIYTATLQKKLPRFRLPLAGDDRDTVLDLSSTFTRTYDQANFGTRIDYQKEPPTRLKEQDKNWLNELLVQHKLRRPAPPAENVAVAAYFLWQQADCPSGRDDEFWFKALAELKRE